jgi:hypothetical protein
MHTCWGWLFGPIPRRLRSRLDLWCKSTSSWSPPTSRSCLRLLRPSLSLSPSAVSYPYRRPRDCVLFPDERKSRSLQNMSADLSFTVVATPVVHTAAVPPRYPTATPRARPSYYEYDEYSDSDILNTPLSFHDAILAFSDWFENDGFNVDFRVTPLRLTIAAFVFGCLQLAFMIFFRDYHLLRKVAMSFFRGVCAVSISYSLLFFLRTFTN